MKMINITKFIRNRIMGLKLHQVLFGLITVIIACTLKYLFLIEYSDNTGNIFIAIFCFINRLLFIDLFKDYLNGLDVNIDLGKILWGRDYIGGSDEKITMSKNTELKLKDKFCMTDSNNEEGSQSDTTLEEYFDVHPTIFEEDNMPVEPQENLKTKNNRLQKEYSDIQPAIFEEDNMPVEPQENLRTKKSRLQRERRAYIKQNNPQLHEEIRSRKEVLRRERRADMKQNDTELYQQKRQKENTEERERKADMKQNNPELHEQRCQIINSKERQRNVDLKQNDPESYQQKRQRINSRRERNANLKQNNPE